MSREILFEIKVSGLYAKVSAIDAATGVEATIVVSSRVGEAAMKQAALRKLDTLLAKTDSSKR